MGRFGLEAGGEKRTLKTIGVTLARHAIDTPPDHPARHPSKQNLHDLVDIVLDCKSRRRGDLLQSLNWQYS